MKLTCFAHSSNFCLKGSQALRSCILETKKKKCPGHMALPHNLKLPRDTYSPCWPWFYDGLKLPRNTFTACWPSLKKWRSFCALVCLQLLISSGDRYEVVFISKNNDLYHLLSTNSIKKSNTCRYHKKSYIIYQHNVINNKDDYEKRRTYNYFSIFLWSYGYT